MPIYEYRCHDCGKEFEKLVRFSDPNIQTPKCPVCESEHTRKQLSTVAAFGRDQSGSSLSSSCGTSSGFR